MPKEKFKFRKEVCQSFRNVKGWTFSDKFVVSFTGCKANIFDKNLNLLYTITDLKCVYHGYISNDESKLLLVSSSNLFYVFSLEKFVLLQKYALQGRFNYSIDGCGAWGFDNNTFLIGAIDKYSLCSCIMIFSPHSTSPIKQIEFKNHCFTKILSLNHLNKHLLIGTDHLQDHKNCLVFLQNDDIEEYIIEDFDDIIHDAEYNPILDKYIIYGAENTIICDECGLLINSIDIQKSIGNTSFFIKNWLNELNLSDKKKYEMLQNILNLLGGDNEVFENINKLLWSKNLNMILGATNNRFFVYDNSDKKIVFSKVVPFGVYDLVEINDNRVILQTWNGTNIYRYEI